MKVLGLYEWSGCNPLPPELWLLPSSFPFSPGKPEILFLVKRKSNVFLLLAETNYYITTHMFPARIWSFMRNFYAPVSYLYGKKFVGPVTELILSLRDEIYTQPYDKIDWNKARHLCFKVSHSYTCAHWYC